MRKIPSVFKRNYETDRLCRDEVVEGCEWVLAGEGVATRKWDGAAAMVKGGVLYKRYDRKPRRDGEWKPAPEGWEPCQEPDEVTKHWPGWLLVGDGPEDWYFREAHDPSLPDGTYECVGPKIGGNPDGFSSHQLVRHGLGCYEDCPRTHVGLRAFLAETPIEGVVFHHPDGRMAKVKARDLGLQWPRRKETGGDE